MITRFRFLPFLLSSKKSMGKIRIRYNRHTRLWEAWNEKLLMADADKNKILLTALKHDHPQMHGTIRSICRVCSLDGNGHGIPTRLINRIIKAVQLIAKGKVDLQHGHVYSQNGNPKPYYVSFSGLPKVWSCTCPDFKQGGVNAPGYGRVCKHTLAYMIAQFLGEDFTRYAPHNPQYANINDFLQGMDDRHARRLHDPAYLKALEQGGDAVMLYALQAQRKAI